MDTAKALVCEIVETERLNYFLVDEKGEITGTDQTKLPPAGTVRDKSSKTISDSAVRRRPEEMMVLFIKGPNSYSPRCTMHII